MWQGKDLLIDAEIKRRLIEGSQAQKMLLVERNALFKDIERKGNQIDLPGIRDAIQIAESLEYRHGRLSKEEYLLHPIRVARYTMSEVEDPTTSLVNIALLHNLVELTDYNKEHISNSLGSDVALALEKLYRDRNNKARSYEEDYYKQLREADSAEACMVKCLDKYDNLFMICFNTDEGRRDRYLKEIEEFVMPLVVDFIPSLEVSMSRLVDFMRRIGGVSRDEFDAPENEVCF